MSTEFSVKVEFLLDFLSRVGVSEQRLAFIANMLKEKHDRRYSHYFLQIELDKADPEMVAKAVDSFALYPKWLLYDVATYNLLPYTLKREYLPELKLVTSVDNRYMVLPEKAQPLKKILGSPVLRSMLRRLKPFAQAGERIVNYKDFAHVNVHNSTRFSNIWRLRDLGVITHLQRGSINKDGLYAIDTSAILEYNEVIDALGLTDEREIAGEVCEQGLVLAAV